MGHPLGQLCFPCHGGDQRRPAFHQRRFDHRAAKDLGVKTSLGAAQSGHAYDPVFTVSQSSASTSSSQV